MKKILIVDDDPDILYVLKLVLSQHHFIVKTISRWQVISKTVRMFAPDLILLDIDLCGKNRGYICEGLKASIETQQIPVIVSSIHNNPEEYLKAFDAQGFLPKPFESTNLLNIIKGNLN